MHRPPFVTLTLAALATVALAAVAPSAGAADATVDVHPNATPTEAQDPNGTLELANWTAGTSYTWNLTTTSNYTTVDLRIHDGFNVTRGKQLVPLVNGSHFVELRGSGPGSVDRPATVFNLSQGGAEGDVSWTYHLGIPGPQDGTLTLHRDVEPPGYKLGDPYDVRHYGFTVETETSEVAMATLHIEPPGTSDEEPQSYQTPRPGPTQRFPAQGLEPDTTYTWWVVFEDWSGNTATSPELTVTTAEEPNPPKPKVTPVKPVPNSTVEPRNVVVEGRWESPESPVVPGGIRLFVDKVPIPNDNITILEDRFRYVVPDPLPTRNVSVGAEVPNQAGGTGIARWSFQVQEASSPAGRSTPLGPALALAGLAVAGLAGRRARRT